METSSEYHRAEQSRNHDIASSVAQKIHDKYEALFRPASSAARDALIGIANEIPAGDMRQSVIEMIPQMKDLLSAQDRNLVMGSFMQAIVGPFVLGLWGGVGGTALGALGGNPAVGAAGGALTGIGVGLSFPSVAQEERLRIRLEAEKQKMVLKTAAGKTAAGMFDSHKVNEVTQAIIWGTGSMGAPGKILDQAAT